VPGILQVLIRDMVDGQVNEPYIYTLLNYLLFLRLYLKSGHVIENVHENTSKIQK
jgi:hypothetical protein